MTTSFNNIRLTVARLEKNKAERQFILASSVQKCHAEFERDPIGAQLALQKVVLQFTIIRAAATAKKTGTKAPVLKLIPTSRAVTGYTLPKTAGCAIAYTRYLRDLAPNSVVHTRQKRTSKVVTEVGKLAKWDKASLLLLQAALPALIKAAK